MWSSKRMKIFTFSHKALFLIHFSLIIQITAIIDTFDEGKIAEIGCSEGYIIKLITVKYYNQELKCGDPEAFPLVGELCDGQVNCTFMADDNLFEDSECADEIPEQLRIEYECISVKVHTFIACNILIFIVLNL